MTTYRVPIVIKGYAILKYPEGKAAGDYTGGLPRDAEKEVLVNTPFILRRVDGGVHDRIGRSGANCAVSE